MAYSARAGLGNMDYKSLSEETNHVRVEFIKLELDTAITIAKHARQSTDAETVASHRRNARRAYDAGLHLLSTTTLSQMEYENVTAKLEWLRSALESLGEEF